MAKSSRRKKQDRAKTQARRAEQVRLRARAERARRASERITRLLDPATPPADVAEILAAEFPDSLAAGGMIHTRLNVGVPAADVAETARLMRAGDEAATRTGTLAVAAAAAHLAGDEDAEQGYVRELLARADAEMEADGDPYMRLEVIRSIARLDHAGRACELIEPYVREHPSDDHAGEIYAVALMAAQAKSDPDEADRAALARFADRTGFEELREALTAFAGGPGGAGSAGAGSGGDGRKNWKEHVRREMDALRAQHEKECPPGAGVGAFDPLAFELVLAFPYGDKPLQGAPGTPLQAFAEDPGTPADLAARAMAWHDHVQYGMWQVADPEASPGVECTDLVSGAERYVHFPAETMAGAAPWAVWFGPLVPVDGVWRSTGSGFWLSPVEGDALAEYVTGLVSSYALKESGVPADSIPDPQPARFGYAETYGVYAGIEDPMDPESADVISMLIASAAVYLASWVWLKRAGEMPVTNTEGQSMVIIDATVAVRGDLTERLLALPDFGEEEDGEDGQLVWWGDPVDDEPFLPADEPKSLVRGRLKLEDGRLLVRVNSRERLALLLKILTAIGAQPEITEERLFEPSVEFAWGPVPATAGRPPLEWERAWADQQISILDAGTPRHAMAVGDESDLNRVESMLRQLEYQAAIATARGEQPLDTAWLRTELDPEKSLPGSITSSPGA